VLRAPVPQDVEARMALGRHAEIARMFGAAEPTTGPVSRQQVDAGFARLRAEGAIGWVVEAEGSFLGTARLHSFGAEGSARFAIGLLDPARLGRGFGTETTRLVLSYGFDELGLERVEVAVLEINERAQRCFARCGFRPTDRVQGAAVIEGRSYDDLVLAIRRDEFHASQTSER
jgi:RimJ/RimL family protein N-acetyltransferase